MLYPFVQLKVAEELVTAEVVKPVTALQGATVAVVNVAEAL